MAVAARAAETIRLDEEVGVRKEGGEARGGAVARADKHAEVRARGGRGEQVKQRL